MDITKEQLLDVLPLVHWEKWDEHGWDEASVEDVCDNSIEFATDADGVKSEKYFRNQWSHRHRFKHIVALLPPRTRNASTQTDETTEK